MSTLSLLAFALASAAIGGMVFFAAAVAPTVFRVLPETEAGRFIRVLFRHYYLVFGLMTAFAGLAALAAGLRGPAALLALVAAGFALARQGLMPRINALRDRMNAGDGGAKAAFDALHRTSVWLNGFQLMGLAAILVLLARA